MALAALAVLQTRQAMAESGRCFDFSSPTLEKLLVPSQAQRLFVQVKNPVPEARLAAAALSGEAKRRGIEAVLSPEAWNTHGESEQDHAVRLCKENGAQLVASVQFLTGTNPEAARAEFWDQAGQSVGSLVGWMADGISCPPALAGPVEPVASSPQHKTWYGWQLMIADAASFALLFSPVPGLAAGTYWVAPPLIHAAHGQGWKAGTSVGLRLGVPLVAMLVSLGASSGSCDSRDEPAECAAGWLGVGFLVGAIVAAAIDDVAFAWEVSDDPGSRTDPAETRPASKPPGLSVSVGLLPYRQGAGLGLAGRF